jgi:hypothetical protein
MQATTEVAANAVVGNTEVKSTELSIEKLRDLYRSNVEARIILDTFARREKSSSVTTVERVTAENEFARAAVISFFAQLQETGAGTFIVGRRGGASRFEWSTNLIAVAKLAQGQTEPLIEPSNETHEATQEIVAAPSHRIGRPRGSKNKVKANSNAQRQKFAIRSDFVAKFTLPEDMTATEAQRIGDYIKLFAVTQ